MSREPFGLDGPNLYLFVFNDPVNHWDFAGLLGFSAGIEAEGFLGVIGLSGELEVNVSIDTASPNKSFWNRLSASLSATVKPSIGIGAIAGIGVGAGINSSRNVSDLSNTKAHGVHLWTPLIDGELLVDRGSGKAHPCETSVINPSVRQGPRWPHKRPATPTSHFGSLEGGIGLSTPGAAIGYIPDVWTLNLLSINNSNARSPINIGNY